MKKNFGTNQKKKLRHLKRSEMFQPKIKKKLPEVPVVNDSEGEEDLEEEVTHEKGGGKGKQRKRKTTQYDIPDKVTIITSRVSIDF